MERGKIEAITMWAFFEQVLLPRSAVAAGFLKMRQAHEEFCSGRFPTLTQVLGLQGCRPGCRHSRGPHICPRGCGASAEHIPKHTADTNIGCTPTPHSRSHQQLPQNKPQHPKVRSGQTPPLTACTHRNNGLPPDQALAPEQKKP